ncbi:hypothetical protein [Halomonas sp. H10-9-1]|uniref:hypothetical protein n=1 Tax=Halomonas sp. H10-9-1 TaxID=2950871 RepID=UPI0032DEE4F3
MNTTQPYLFRGEIPTPKGAPKRRNRRWPVLPTPKLMQWAPWILLGVLVYGLLFWGLSHMPLPSLSNHLLALMGVIATAACLELGSWVRDGKLPLALMPLMGAGGLLALLMTLL